MSFVFGTALLAVVTALACAVPGVFVVLRRNSMIVEAIAHAVLPGIVLGFMLTNDLQSPWLLFGAAVSGLLVVIGSEYLGRLGVLSGDAPQGLVFPALFSVGVILISSHIKNVHLCVDTVLVGDLNLASFEDLTIGGSNIGPRYLYIMTAVLLFNVVFLAANYRRLQLTTLDDEFARSLGMRTGVFNMVFMLTVALTITAAFHAAGALLVVGLIVVPAATAYLVSTRLSTMIWLTMVIAAVGATVGFWLAYVTNTATSAGLAVTYFLIFTMAFLGVRLHRSWVQRRLAGGDNRQDPATPEHDLADATR